MKLWGGRFDKGTHCLVEEFTASIDYDQRLAPYDIKGSRAHAKMLSHQNIIKKEELEAILRGLDEIQKEIIEGKFSFTKEDEDIHLHIEKALIGKIGEMGGRLHTGRSRNDQVMLDIRLYLCQEVQEISLALLNLLEEILKKAQANLQVILPGYTHLQRAQPIRLSHHFLAYYEMLKRDLERLFDVKKRIEVMPLGSGALAGSPLPLDREYVANELGFPRISKNSMDAVSDRDFMLEFLSFGAITGTHLSRLAEDMILWSTAEFNFIELPDSLCTGSSIMPQKKNPDVLELLRGKTGRLNGNLICLLTVMKGLPLSYNRDLQEDKEALFDTIDTIKPCLVLTQHLIQQMVVKREEMYQACKEGFLLATDVADYLVEKGLPFRLAHTLVGKIVKEAMKEKKELSDLTYAEWQDYSPFFEPDIFSFLHIHESVDRRDLPGGPALVQNQTHIQSAFDEIRRYREDLKKEGGKGAERW